jgi:ABC-type phosphate transport system permease subunit
MSKATTQALPLSAADLPAPNRLGNRVFEGLTLVSAAMSGVLFRLVVWVLVSGARMAMGVYGWSFLTNMHWNPVTDN